ncbi:hypothetical protein [Synechococcus phage S-B68]|nr:hypothetical protein [Synechococcus phage S-B68]
MNFSELNKDNFILFAIKHYENPRTSTQEEFEEDLNRFKYVKRWLRKYHESGEMNSHLLLNHILIIFNCWQDAALPMFFFKVEPKYWSYLKSFFMYLERIPEFPRSILHDIVEDISILNELRGL